MIFFCIVLNLERRWSFFLYREKVSCLWRTFWLARYWNLAPWHEYSLLQLTLVRLLVTLGSERQTYENRALILYLSFWYINLVTSHNKETRNKFFIYAPKFRCKERQILESYSFFKPCRDFPYSLQINSYCYIAKNRWYPYYTHKYKWMDSKIKNTSEKEAWVKYLDPKGKKHNVLAVLKKHHLYLYHSKRKLETDLVASISINAQTIVANTNVQKNSKSKVRYLKVPVVILGFWGEVKKWHLCFSLQNGRRS